MIKVIQTGLSKETVWDAFVDSSINGTFIQKMQYSRYRELDETFLVFQKNDASIPLAMMSGTVTPGRVFASHSHLTYGGFIFQKPPKTTTMIQLLECLSSYLKSQEIFGISYKPSPGIYHKQPLTIDIGLMQTLFLPKRTIKVSSVIELNHRQIPISYRKKRNLNKSRNESLTFSSSSEYLQSFWTVLERNLRFRHQTKPAHTFSEIFWLSQQFPENIKHFFCLKDNAVVAGMTLFISDFVCHIQYMSTSEIGREIGALDILIVKYLELCKQNYFDFGHSHNPDGELNHGLANYKHEFGGGHILYETYEWTL
jgi:hypothetical protein